MSCSIHECVISLGEHPFEIPAKAGIQYSLGSARYWIPAFAGISMERINKLIPPNQILL